MGDKYFLLRQRNNSFNFVEALLLESPAQLKLIDHKLKFRILKLLKAQPMYPAELAKKLKVHEQNVYYHLKQMHLAGVVEIVEEKQIRGTTAKRFASVSMNFALSMGDEWHDIRNLTGSARKDTISDFLSPFINDGVLDAQIIVGNPDPHGPHKARARDGHYAIDLALLLGNFCNIPEDFSVTLDVDANSQEILKQNLIVVGGPVTNLIQALLNEHFPTRFSDKKPWGLISKYDAYTDDSVGLIVRIPNPFNKDAWILAIAGIRFIGTKSAIMALTRNHDVLLKNFHNQNRFAKVVQGFDFDGDGKIDTVEVLE